MKRTRSSTAEAVWPDDVPILCEDDVTWNYSTQDGRRDLCVWLETVFNPDYPHQDNPAYHEAERVLAAVVSERIFNDFTMADFMAHVAHSKAPDFAWQAACWNEMLHRLGYEVDKKARRNPDPDFARERNRRKPKAPDPDDELF